MAEAHDGESGLRKLAELQPALAIIDYLMPGMNGGEVARKARWGIGGDESRTQFAVVLFVGMIVHGLFAEVLNRSP